jgi:hypothetical protein
MGDSKADAGVPRVIYLFLPEGRSSNRRAVLSGLASKWPSQGSSIRPTGQLSNSRRLTWKPYRLASWIRLSSDSGSGGTGEAGRFTSRLASYRLRCSALRSFLIPERIAWDNAATNTRRLTDISRTSKCQPRHSTPDRTRWSLLRTAVRGRTPFSGRLTGVRSRELRQLLTGQG